MATISKTDKIRFKLQELEKIEITEREIFKMAEKAVSGDFPCFNISIKEIPPKSNKEPKITLEVNLESYLDSFRGLMDRSMFSHKQSKKTENSALNLELSDNQLLNFFGVYVDLLAIKKKNIIRSLNRLGVKF